MPVRIYILADPADGRHEERLVRHLIPAERFSKAIVVQRSNALEAGMDITEQRQRDIDEAQIVLLLVSRHFWATCYDLAQRALAQKKRVVPVLVQDTAWKEADFGNLKPLPHNEKPVASWSNADAAWADVVENLRPLWEAVASTKTPVATGAARPPVTPRAGAPAGRATPYQPIDPPPPPPVPLGAGEKLRILFITANPSNSTRLLLGEEQRRIRDRVLKATGRDQLEFVPEPELRINEVLGALMRTRPHVVHFSGHGSSDGAVMLADPSVSGKSRPVDSLALRQMFTVVRDNVQCVFLNSCWSVADEQQAMALADAAGCVVGVASTISDDAAIELAASFYESLASERDFRTAFEVAKINLDVMEQPESKLIRLYHRANVDPSKLPFAPR